MNPQEGLWSPQTYIKLGKRDNGFKNPSIFLVTSEEL